MIRDNTINIISVGLILTTAIACSYWYITGSYSNSRKRRGMEKKLQQALHTVRDLEEKLISIEQDNIREKVTNGKEIRIWMDGAFDMMHYGHMNAFRQGRSLGTYLIVGVNSDETITACKGPPVCGEHERIETVRGCKWVDEVVEGVPYIMSEEYLKYVIAKYNIDYVVHGDDPCIVDGKDVYESAMKMGKYLTIPRTEGISTTDIVGRILLMTRSHHSSDNTIMKPVSLEETQLNQLLDSNNNTVIQRPFVRKSRFLTTSHTIRLFGAGTRIPKATDKIIYLAGCWDMFHAGHIEILEKAKKLGDYIIVGVHSDSVVNAQRGYNLPIMNMHERVLSVLGCKWVDDVLIDASIIITKEMIQSLRINLVVTGTYLNQSNNYDMNVVEEVVTNSNCVVNIVHNHDAEEDNNQEQIINDESDNSSPSTSEFNDNSYSSQYNFEEGEDRYLRSDIDIYAVPREMGILQVISSSSSTSEFVRRIQAQRKRFDEKYQKKSKNENHYYMNKYKKNNR